MKRKLDEVIEIYQGTNLTRLKASNEEVEPYDQKSFDLDLRSIFKKENSESISEGNTVVAGDLVINVMNQKATIVTKENENKKLTNNFFKISINCPDLDKYYFVYYFNESKELRRQILKNLQGSTLIQRINKRGLLELNIDILPLEKQLEISNAYLQLFKVKSEFENKYEKLEKLTLTVLQNKISKGGK